MAPFHLEGGLCATNFLWISKKYSVFAYSIIEHCCSMVELCQAENGGFVNLYSRPILYLLFASRSFSYPIHIYACKICTCNLFFSIWDKECHAMGVCTKSDEFGSITPSVTFSYKVRTPESIGLRFIGFVIGSTCAQYKGTTRRRGSPQKSRVAQEGA